MLELYIDPYTLACPIDAVGEQEVDDFVEGLLALRELAKKGLAFLFLPSRCFEVLESSNSYPVGDRMQRFAHQQRRDMLEIVQRLLSSTTSVEQASGIDDLIVENATCAPNGHTIGRPELFIYEYHRLHAIIGLSVRHDGEVVHSPAVYTRGLASGSVVVLASGSVPICEKAECSTTSAEYRVNILNLGKPDAVVSAIDPVSEWIAENVELAISVAVAVRGSTSLSASQRPWRIGKSFVASARSYGFLHEPTKIKRLLDACVDSIVGERLRDVHELRTGSGGSTTQVVRPGDGARAWRRDIDDEFHLHYWQSTSVIELALVVVHNTFTIPS